jgi:hypothetical protein
MMSKPRYWHAAYPLAITSLCVAPHQFFLRNWTACFEAGLSKIKAGSPFLNFKAFINRYDLGKALSCAGYEWDDAVTLDIYVPLSRANVYHDLQVGFIIKTLLPCQSSFYLSTR